MLNTTTHAVDDTVPAPRGRRVRVLVVDDEPVILRAWERMLDDEHYHVTAIENPLEALAHVKDEEVDVAVLDLRMPHMSGLELLREIKGRRPEIEVIVMTAYATVDTAVQAVKLGAYDYLTKPFENIDAAILTVHKAAERKQLIDRNTELEKRLALKERYQDLVGKSPRMLKTFQLIESVASSACNVLIQGESGTGKELVARAIHQRSPRKDRPFVVINCSALTETLLESELFGHVKGSFTGATSDKKGLFEVADGGTIFLDEIGEIASSTQVKLLRVLQEGDIKRVGSTRVIQVDVRTLAATNVDLDKARETGAFREDLYYRLNVITIPLPPLRDRIEDVTVLAYHFLRKHSPRLKPGGQTGPQRIAPEVMEVLQGYHWPGNVRELENVIERACVLAEGDSIQLGDLPPHLSRGALIRDGNEQGLVNLPYKSAKELALRNFEKKYIAALLARSRGNISRASRSAGMDRSNFRRIVKKYSLDIREFKARS
jgi:two-component system response regulator HydG